jgi:hypothetical protein
MRICRFTLHLAQLRASEYDDVCNTGPFIFSGDLHAVPSSKRCFFISGELFIYKDVYLLSRVGRGFWTEIEFIDHFITRLVTTSNYSTIANLHTFITTALAKSFPACNVITSSCLVTVSNSGDSSASALKAFLMAATLQFYSVAPVVFLVTPRYGPTKTQLFYCYLNRFRGNVSCLWRRYTVTALVYLLISRS